MLIADTSRAGTGGADNHGADNHGADNRWAGDPAANLGRTDLAPAAAADELAGVRRWLVAVAALVVLMILVGGATRLTDSGLSITEWRPVTGWWLPSGEAAWAAEFDKYRRIPQYELVNKGMTLAAFQTIYAWEWAHRLLGRLIGLAYLVPLAVFVARGRVRGRLLVMLLAIGALGGLQGGIGWIMVASGLEPGMVAVAPVKLMLHLLAACAILVALVALAVTLAPPGKPNLAANIGPNIGPPYGYATVGYSALGPARASAALLCGLILVQIGLGALVAGLDAGLVYNTWPLMDGSLVPDRAVLLPRTPWWANAFETVATVQFNHRAGAVIVLLAALGHAAAVRRAGPSGAAARRAAAIAALVAAQAGLGIATLVLQVPLWAGLAHQAMAMLVLVAAVAHATLLRCPA